MGRRVLTTNLPTKINMRDAISEIEAATSLVFSNDDFSLSVKFQMDNVTAAEILIVAPNADLNSIQTAIEAHSPTKSDSEEQTDRDTERQSFDIDRIIVILKDFETRITALGG